ncbi:MAG: Lrp/AsnC family transcriptional regulator [Clostridia bacterium]|nr:Lrp/AsnC family transcriptional regulator [Clostridia bacterium]
MDLKKKVLNALQDDARYTPKKLGVMFGVEEKEIEKVISELEKDGVIVKYTAVINHEKTGEELVDALVEVKVTPQARAGFEKIAEDLSSFPEVKSVYLMSGTYDFSITLEGTTMRDVALFISERLSGIDCVTSVTTHFILKKYKEGGILLGNTKKSKRISIHE